MNIIAIDLGTTNVKVALYDSSLKMLNIESKEVKYDRRGDFVEFDAENYYQTVASTIKKCIHDNSSPNQSFQIALTGQAESLVVVGKDLLPIRKAISWLDERSRAECQELKQYFTPELCFLKTGQVSIIPTWPITKILWIRKHEPDIFSEVYKYLLLKDYIQFKLTGKLLGELSIYNFSFYFDIRNKCYWAEILEYCGVSTSQLPELIEPCSNIGYVTNSAASLIGLGQNSTVNVGTLDHFAGMIGTGNITEGIVSESTGTVLSVATIINQQLAVKPTGIPCHYGPFKDTYVLLSVCESGGISLEWFKNNFLNELSYSELNTALESRETPSDLIFLPFLTGINAPDYNDKAKGVFYGLKIKHDKIDLALSVMEGVAHMLSNNVEKMRSSGIDVKKIISTGGGARSKKWSEIKASVTECDIVIPENEEAACLGAAMISAVDSGLFSSFEQVIIQNVKIIKTYSGSNFKEYKRQHMMFNYIYNNLKDIFNMF